MIEKTTIFIFQYVYSRIANYQSMGKLVSPWQKLFIASILKGNPLVLLTSSIYLCSRKSRLINFCIWILSQPWQRISYKKYHFLFEACETSIWFLYIWHSIFFFFFFFFFYIFFTFSFCRVFLLCGNLSPFKLCWNKTVTTTFCHTD